MKMLLLGFVRIAHMPYMIDYVSAFGSECELHLISWNRSGEEDSPAPSGIARSFTFSDLMEDEDPLEKKLPHIFRYRRFAIDLIERERYDKIIVLHSTPGIALLDYLAGNYSGNYLLDYRDVSHENLGFYRRLIKRLSLGAGLVIASSPAYFQYLENERGVVLKHNLLLEEALEPRRHGSPIRVRYWGMIRHEAANVALVDELGGDERFELHYNGREEIVAKRLKEHVAEKGYGNVFFHGAYYNDARTRFAADTDILHNVYENDFVTVGAMGNKYYDGIQFRVPQLCTAGSRMGEEVLSKGLGIAVDYSRPGFKDQIVEYLEEMDFERFDEACDMELRAIKTDNARAAEAISRFISR